MEKEIAVGIDLGTTYSAVAYYNEQSGRVEMLKNGEGEEVTPSVVAVDDGKFIIGVPAKDMQAAGYTEVAAFYKSMMGDPAFVKYIDGQELSAEDLSREFLRALKAETERANGVRLRDAVITVPAYFNEDQRQATLRAGEGAGFHVLKIINEPTAAIIAYGLTGGPRRNVLVYDLGGGTFDVTVAEVNGSRVRVLGTTGNHQLGGQDFDRVLIRHIVSCFEAEHGINIEDHPEDYNELTVKCEKLKKQLTTSPQAVVSVQCDGLYGKYTVTRAFFEEETRMLLEETMMLCERCFTEIGNGFSWKKIDEIVLVGGSTRMPQIGAALREKTGRAPTVIGARVDTVVAAGAAISALLCRTGSVTLNPVALGNVHGKSDAPAGGATLLTLTQDSVRDVTSHGLGMLAFGRDGETIVNSIIIPKNGPVGEAQSREYTFTGKELNVYVLQGESEDPHDCTLLYRYSLTGMPRDNRRLSVQFLYNQNGVVEVGGTAENGAALRADRVRETRSLDEVLAELYREREKAKKEAARRVPPDITFMVDTSGSMSGHPIKQVREAIYAFIDQFSGLGALFSLMIFDDTCTYLFSGAEDKARITTAVNALDSRCAENGAEPFGQYNRKKNGRAPRIIICLTDGVWMTQNAAIQSTDALKKDGVTIYAIGFGSADEEFLRKIASDGSMAKKIDLSKLTTTFREIASGIATEAR